MFSVEYNLLVCSARILKIHHFSLLQWPKLMSAIYPLQISIVFTPRMNLAAQYWNRTVLYLNGYASLNAGQCLMAERQMKLSLIKLSSDNLGWQGKNNVFSYAHLSYWWFFQIKERSINCQRKIQGENVDSVLSPFWEKAGGNWRHQPWRQLWEAATWPGPYGSVGLG